MPRIHQLYAFGSSMPGYSYKADSADGYRFGFNGMENQDNLLVTYYRIYNSQLGRWLTIDPEASSLPMHSPYSAMYNNPILIIDPLGNKPPFGYKNEKGIGKSDLTLPPSAEIIKRMNDIDKDGKILLDLDGDGKENNVTVAQTGEVSTFRVNGKTYRREFNLDGSLKGYFNGKEQWVNSESADYIFTINPKVEEKTVPEQETSEERWNRLISKSMVASPHYEYNSDGSIDWVLYASQCSYEARREWAGGGDFIYSGWTKLTTPITAAEVAPLNRLNHMFGKSEHALESLVTKFGSQEGAYNAVQNAANQALKSGKLTPNAKGILPTGDLGNIIKVGDMDVRLIGGRVENGQVILSSFSRKGL